MRDFEGLAAEAAARNTARLVKLIGDGAMIAAPFAEAVAGATQDLVAMVSGDERFRGAHGGIASGRVVARNGDYLGAPVNLASRLSEIARTGEILCDEMTAAALPGRVRIGRRPHVARIRRATTGVRVEGVTEHAAPGRSYRPPGSPGQLKMLTPPGPMSSPMMMSTMPMATAPRTRYTMPATTRITATSQSKNNT